MEFCAHDVIKGTGGWTNNEIDMMITRIQLQTLPENRTSVYVGCRPLLHTVLWLDGNSRLLLMVIHHIHILMVNLFHDILVEEDPTLTCRQHWPDGRSRSKHTPRFSNPFRHSFLCNDDRWVCSRHVLCILVFESPHIQENCEQEQCCLLLLIKKRSSDICKHSISRSCWHWRARVPE